MSTHFQKMESREEARLRIWGLGYLGMRIRLATIGAQEINLEIFPVLNPKS